MDNFTVTAVPEPSTLFLLTTGVFGLICCRRKTRSTRVDYQGPRPAAQPRNGAA